LTSLLSSRDLEKVDEPILKKLKGNTFEYLQLISHSLAYDKTKADTITNPFNSTYRHKIFDKVTEIKSKVDGKINYEGKALVGKSLLNPNILVIAFRGTDNNCNIVEDIRIFQTKFTNKTHKSYHSVKVHQGFYNVYLSLRGEIRNTVLEFLKNDKSIDTIIFTGHSLGGALANLCAVDMNYYYNEADGKVIKPEGYTFNLVTFGSPRVGDQIFANYVNSIKTIKTNLRVVYKTDLVSQIPVTSDYVHAGTLAKYYYDNEIPKLVWSLGKINTDDSPRLEYVHKLFDPKLMSKHVESIIILMDCNTPIYKIFAKIGVKVGIFKIIYSTIADFFSGEYTEEKNKLVEDAKNHSDYKYLTFDNLKILGDTIVNNVNHKKKRSLKKYK
jgi:hypothetical protein